ncbi:MAG: MATE family efflux transporter [Candidatus Neomarinimicrobiota bacterium]
MPFKLKQLFKVNDPRITAQILTLGLPVIASNLSRTIMSLADVAMVGRLGAGALAATGMGSMLVWVVLSIAIGLRTATQTVASRRLGQKIYKECGTALQTGLLLVLFIMVPITYFGLKTVPVFVPFFIDDPEITPLCLEYTSIAYFSIIFSSLGFVFQGFFTGIEKTRVHMKVTVAANLINVYLNAGLIYGSQGLKEFLDSSHLGWMSWLWSWANFPALGVKGAALATVLASLWLMLHYFYYLFNGEMRKKFAVFSLHFNRKIISRQISLALPQGLQEVIVTAGYAVFFKIVGLLGVTALAATEVVFTIMHASFMSGMGIGQACATLVGKALGEEDPRQAEISIIESVRLSFWIMGTTGLIFLFIPNLILSLFTNDPQVLSKGLTALRITGLVQFVDAVGLTLWFALSGAGNTRFPAVLETITMWAVCLPLSYLTGVYWGWGMIGPWAAFGVNILLFAGFMAWKVGKGDWKEIKV